AKPVPAKPVAAQPKPVSATPPASTAPAPRYDPVDALDRLRALATMLDEGLIDRSEFDAKKAKILDRL
ncbi:MAG: SHOCT domain-containing protein, partial [Acidimicrobiales bacterium]|nr:SHOCT domain-containing protein [Acidimicrobiales bacterium]